MVVLALVRLAPSAPAATFYVSPSGSDAGPGTQSAPFATVQFGAGRLNPGDVLCLRAGAYYESVTVNQSGTAAAPITIQSYPGETAVLVGSRPVTGPWTVQAGSIYRAPWPTQPVQVFCDGQLLNEARWPNSALPGDIRDQACAFTDDASTNDIVYANLPAVDLTGAWIQIVSGEAWVGYSRQVIAHDQASGRLTFAEPINQISELVPRRGNRFFVFGKLELLDAPGEWWWDPTGQQLYVWTPDSAPPANRVEAGAAGSVLSLGGQSHITVMGLNARGGWFNLQDCTACVVNGCSLVAPTWIRTFDGFAIWPTPYLGGINVSGSGNVVQGGSVRLAGRSAVHLAGSDNTLRQMTIEDCGWNWTNNAAVEAEDGVRITVENCTVSRVAGTGLTMGPASRFLCNAVDTTAVDFEDCGDIRAWSMDGQGSEVACNVIHGNNSRWGAGIYLDAGTKNFYVHDNYVYDILWNGINITGPLQVEHNTFVGMQHQGLALVPQSSTDGVDMSAGLLAHNLAAEPFPIDVSLGQPVSLDPEYAMFGASTPLAPGPRRVEILWSQLAQPGWSLQEVPLDLSVVNSIVFNFESPATSFSYSIANLRLLPLGGTGDDGAVAVDGATVQADSSGGSTCTLTTPAAATWTAAGANAFRGANSLTVSLPSGLTDMRAYRGLAFELVGTATRDYKFQGYQDVDNGPDAVPGRGATLPADIGASAAGLGPIAPPVVTTQPASSASAAGGSVSFTVDASGNPAPTYQWQRLAAGSTAWVDLAEGGSYSGTLGATLTVSAPTAAMSGDQFRCVTTSAVGSATSAPATLTVIPAAELAFLQQLFLDVLGRPIDSGAISSYGAALAGGCSQAAVLGDLLGSAEYQQRQIEPAIRLYYAALGRPPDIDGLRTWAGALQAGAITLAGAGDQFAGSAEFLQDYGSLNDTQFVQQIYVNALGRQADVSGLAGWLAQLNAGGARGAVLTGISESSESQTKLANPVEVARLFYLLLQRMPTTAEFQTWLGFLRGDDQTDDLLAQGYFAGLGNSDYVQRVFQGFLRRAADASELSAYGNALAAGTASHGSLVDALLSSAEFNACVAPVSRLYLGALLRAPDSAGLDNWVAYLRAGNSLQSAADAFAASAEFANAYAALGDSDYVSALYVNILGRQADPTGLDAWVAILKGGASRGQVLIGISESTEAVARFAPTVRTFLSYETFLNAAPTQADLDYWINYLATLDDQMRAGLLGLLFPPKTEALTFFNLGRGRTRFSIGPPYITISPNSFFFARFQYAGRRVSPVGAQACCVPLRARQDRAPTFGCGGAALGEDAEIAAAPPPRRMRMVTPRQAVHMSTCQESRPNVLSRSRRPCAACCVLADDFS